jgi:hypothetical protein
MKTRKVIAIVLLSNSIFGIGVHLFINAWLLYQYLIGQTDAYAIEQYLRNTAVSVVLLSILVWILLKLIKSFNSTEKQPNQNIEPIVKTPVE